MNWVEREYASLAEAVDPDIWILTAPFFKQCEHRFRTQVNFKPAHMRGFFSLPVVTLCAKCGAEA